MLRKPGKTSLPLVFSVKMFGSPPCVRGRLLPVQDAAALKRFTPVYTGKTRSRISSSGVGSVHPRVHGEDWSLRLPVLPQSGSPPCARGRRIFRAWLDEALRFTPVCTGKTARPLPPSRRSAVHPRVYGEDMSAPGLFFSAFGSPPCARGRRGPPVGRSTTRAVHPRVHGEDLGRSPRTIAYSGSPPCARGRLRQPPGSGRVVRFTPVCTGKTACLWLCHASAPVHPRVHG